MVVMVTPYHHRCEGSFKGEIYINKQKATKEERGDSVDVKDDGEDIDWYKSSQCLMTPSWCSGDILLHLLSGWLQRAA